MISNKEAREAAMKVKQYCLERENCERCMLGNNCIDGEHPGNWYIEPECLPDDERDFAKQLLSDGYIYINIDFDADGRHVVAVNNIKKNMPGKILRPDDFPSLVEPANYMLSTLVKGYIDGYI